MRQRWRGTDGRRLHQCRHGFAETVLWLSREGGGALPVVKEGG